MAYDDAPKVVKEFLFYLDVANGKSEKTIYEYYLDLRLYFKFMKKHKQNINSDLSLISIHDIDIDFIKQITLSDTYEYLYYMKEKRNASPNTLNRKICCLRVFFKYLTTKALLLERNPIENLNSVSLPEREAKHLSLNESQILLESVDGKNCKRDYAILTLFLNCGLRLAELVSINLSDLDKEFLTVTGKGNKQRSVFLNEVCKDAIEDYLKNERRYDELTPDGRKALFISSRGNRISRRMVQYVVENRLMAAGLGNKEYTTHKLRHTAATLMHKHGGVDIRVLQKVLGHKNLGTTQIYTHIDDEQVKDAIQSNPLSKKNSNNE